MDKKKDEFNLNDINNTKKITQNHLKNLDEFIQKCLDNFKFVEPKPELYEATGEDKNIIISHKSTIPDLVIWNKSFNKNNCFIGANNNIETKFPRFLFYIKIKKNKKPKKNNIDTKNINNNNNNIEENLYNKNNIEKNIDNTNDRNKIGKNNFNYNYNNNYINNEKYNKIEEKNKFSMNSMDNLNQESNINMTINLTTYLIQLYLYKDGWIILTNDNFSGPGTSINLFQFLQEKLKENFNLDTFLIIDINKQVKFRGNNFYTILSNTLNKILQKKQMELIKFEEIMTKQYINNINDNGNNKNINDLEDKMNKMNLNLNYPKLNNIKDSNFNNNKNHININLYNNQIFPGINYIGSINNNISNANFFQNNITNYEYNIKSSFNNQKKINKQIYDNNNNNTEMKK